MSELPDSGRFVVLDTLRGLAALMVVELHLVGGGPVLDSAIVRNGGFFVDFFFVLSGFVIAGAYGERLRQGFSLRRYMTLRAGRIVPLHVAMLLVALGHEVGLSLLSLFGFHTRPVFTGQKAMGPFLATLFLVQSFWVPNPSGWNNVSWSISVEMWLYLMIAFAWRGLGHFAWLLVAVATVLALALLGSGFEQWRSPLSPEIVRGIGGFGLGTLCWHAWKAGVSVKLRRLPLSFATCAELAVVAAVLALLTLPSSDRTYVVIDPLFGCSVLLFAAESGIVSRVLRLAPFVWIGILSYSIYLVHGMVIFYSAHALSHFGLVKLFPGQEVYFIISAPAPFGDLIALAIMLASIGAAWLTWRFIEKPARDWSRRRAAIMGVGKEEQRAPTI